MAKRNYKHADAFPPMWKARAEGESIEGDIISISTEGKFGKTFLVKLIEATTITVKRAGMKESESLNMSAGDVLTLPNHVNLMGALEGKASVGSGVLISCTGFAESDTRGKNDTTLYDVNISEPAVQTKL